MPTIVRKETRKRGIGGKIIKWLFIGFNLLMLIWLFSYWSEIGGKFGNLNEAEQSGAAVGTMLGTTVLMIIWGAGALILGLFVLLTRGKTVIVEERRIDD